MITLFARHTVSDYEKWAEAYRNFAPTLKAKGVVASEVYQSVDNPNDLTVAHDFATLEEAHAFADSPELHTARPGAGVSGTPTLWFTSKL